MIRAEIPCAKLRCDARQAPQQASSGGGCGRRRRGRRHLAQNLRSQLGHVLVLDPTAAGRQKTSLLTRTEMRTAPKTKAARHTPEHPALVSSNSTSVRSIGSSQPLSRCATIPGAAIAAIDSRRSNQGNQTRIGLNQSNSWSWHSEKQNQLSCQTEKPNIEAKHLVLIFSISSKKKPNLFDKRLN